MKCSKLLYSPFYPYFIRCAIKPVFKVTMEKRRRNQSKKSAYTKSCYRCVRHSMSGTSGFKIVKVEQIVLKVT